VTSNLTASEGAYLPSSYRIPVAFSFRRDHGGGASSTLDWSCLIA